MKSSIKDAEKDLQMKKVKEYSKRVARLKPIVGSKEPEGKINKAPKETYL